MNRLKAMRPEAQPRFDTMKRVCHALGVKLGTLSSELPAYIQYGVRTPEAAVAGLLGVLRQLAEAEGADYRDRYGNLQPKETSRFRDHVERADPAD